MNIFNKKDDTQFYEQALLEFDNGNVIQGVLAKATALSEGNDSKIKSYYLKIRVKQLLDESNSEISEEMKEKIKKENKIFRKFLYRLVAVAIIFSQ